MGVLYTQKTVPDTPIQQTVSAPSQHTSSSGNGNAAPGSLVQQILSAPTARQTPTPQHSRQRPIQPKTHNNGRKRASVNSHSGMTNKSSKVDPPSTNSNQTEVRFSMSALTRITEIGAEMAQLQEQQDKLGINNSQRLSELQAQRASILYEALSSQNVGETVLSQVKQVAAAAAPASQTTRSTARVRSGHSTRQTHFESAPESPQYQPQMYLASHNQYPSTSTAQFQDFSTGNANQGQIVHPQEPVTVRHQPQQRIYRTQNNTTTVYHTTSQLPPGTVYVQNVQQATQAQFASSQPTVGEVVRQQHQLRHVSGAQQVIVQQVATPQVVVAAGAQAVGGAQIRTQIVQHSPLPAQIVLAPAVPQTHQVVVVAHRSSPAQAAKRLEEKRASRLSRLRNYFDSLHETLSHPDTETPFTDLRDVLQRLLPYHAYGEPNFSDEHLEQFDSNYMRTTINLMEQRKRLEKRLRKVFYDEALHSTEVEERNLLLYLDGEYERRKLEEERELVKQGNVEAFVRDSPIVAALHDSTRETVEMTAQVASSSKTSSRSVMHQYEYHPFEEIPIPLSPYKSPSPFKSPTSSIRSLSPSKSPCAVAYSPRLRTRRASHSKNSSPSTSAVEPAHTRPSSKPRPTSESDSCSRSSSSKLDQQKEEIHRPIPPPLPNVAARRITPSRKLVDKNSSTHVSSSPSPSQPEKAEILASISTPGRLPAKKELLSRARQGVPAEMRSPPAHSSSTSTAMFVRNSVEDYESDGSASPELGVDDVVVPPPPTPSEQSIKPPTPQVNVLSPAKPAPPPSQKIPQRPAIPAPPLLPQKKEKLNKSPERTSLSVVIQEDVKPPPKREEEKPAERFRFKPQVPRPSPVSPFKSVTPKQECAVEHSNVGKDVNHGELKSLANKKDQVSVCDKPPPIRLKLKLDGKEVYIENNENNSKYVKVQHRPQQLGKSHVRKVENDASPQEVVAVTSNGIRVKLKFGLEPSTSSGSTVVSPQPPKIPRLKIRIGHDAPPLVIAPVRANHPSTTVNAQPVSVASLGTLISSSKPPQVLSAAAHVSTEPLSVEFSDDSDTEVERMRLATDEALRGMSNFTGLTRTNSSVLPWSTQEAP
ncbi:hypothetical protein KIN20_001215 [Parelaphostrongylus tenuis]|uniref:GLTSCR protein conserved domain-containing protein n=1 Tax=Parelaphostrongylus tenuis TaxID=148309 RepID=A0AAD5QCH4_PARTN|nr:hypothetical protein KIN20_001215 [Parelaphostrongylus tenuis]